MIDTETKYEVRGEVDPRAIEQLKRCAESGDSLSAALCADAHLGYSQPIGGVVAYRGQISPSGVGYDIGCGNKAVSTKLMADEIDVPRIMDEIARRVSFGMGRVNDEPVDHPIFDAIANADFEPQRKMLDTANKQLGTVGSGNHYVDLFADDDGRLWIGVHFGSRGFGHKTASGFLALSQGKAFDEHASEGEMDSPPVLFDTKSELGQSYIAAMQLAGDYAYAGRDVVINKVLEILGTEALYQVHNHHNYAWLENHHGEDVWVVRKGCTPAWPGEQGFVGATMGEPSVILEGIESPGAIDLLHSTVHGAGRVMSRTQAAGKMGIAAECNDRDCNFSMPWKKYQAIRKAAGFEGKPYTVCPEHLQGTMRKIRIRLRDGAINFNEVQKDLVTKGIELRGAAADEAPGAYKRLDVVLNAHDDTIRILKTLTPIGVAMAGSDVQDFYKD